MNKVEEVEAREKSFECFHVNLPEEYPLLWTKHGHHLDITILRMVFEAGWKAHIKVLEAEKLRQALGL